MGGMEGRVWRGRERWRLRHITFPQCIKGTGLSVTHTVRMGRGGGDGEGGEREGQREEETERKRMRKREKERRGLVFFYPTFGFFSIPPSPISDVIQVTYSSQGGSLPPLPLPLFSFYLCLSSSLLSPHSADWLNA